MGRDIRVLVVEDSLTARKHICHVLSTSPGLEVVGEAGSGAEAMAQLARHQPDIISMDVFLPDETAAELVPKVLSQVGVPIVLVSDAASDAREVFAAISAGALDMMPKPRVGDSKLSVQLVRAIRTLASVKVLKRSSFTPSSPRVEASAVAEQSGSDLELVVICGSTGGPPALKAFISRLPKGFSLPIVIGQHLESGYENSMAEWLAEGAGVEVRVARLDTMLQPNVALLGVAHHDLVIRTRQEVSVIKPTATSSLPHPAGDVLLSSASRVFKKAAAGVVLGGLSSDSLAGAAGLAKAGGRLFVHASTSSSANAMQSELVRRGIAHELGAPEQLAEALARLANGPRSP